MPEFYVYRLVDPRDNCCFYIGKGKGRRAWEHEIAVRRGLPYDNKLKHRRISEIILAGKSVRVEVLAWFHDERDAFRHERYLIAYGRKSGQRLTNISPGASPLVFDPEEATRRVAVAKAARETLRREKQDNERRRILESVPPEKAAEVIAWYERLAAATSDPALRAEIKAERTAPAAPVFTQALGTDVEKPKKRKTGKRKLRRKYRPGKGTAGHPAKPSRAWSIFHGV